MPEAGPMDDPLIVVLTEQVRQLREDLRDLRMRQDALSEAVRQSSTDGQIRAERLERIRLDLHALVEQSRTVAEVTRGNTIEISKRAAWMAGVGAAIATGISVVGLVAKLLGG